ncbi:hypothetical protein QBC41DRAFT_288019 [Cercophora samala]|uniref:SUN domain-containing protein n=1 Tax=Cercophora samala TaxID=330535 RepID=A0AA40CXG3_9PEZI|nr:hypothetical protein QBC41DRAFT_288019 [Cercophora samala]
MTDALSSPTTSLHISLNLSQDTGPSKSLHHNTNSNSLFTMPPRQHPGRGSNVPSPSPQQRGRAGTPSSVRSSRKPIDAAAVRVDVPVKYSTSYGSSMPTLPDRVRIMGGGNIRKAVHGVVDQVIKDREAADARLLAKQQELASRTDTSSQLPPRPVQPQTGGRTQVLGKTTLSQQISRSESEQSDGQGGDPEDDGPSQQTLVGSQHDAITSRTGGVISGNRSRSGSAGSKSTSLSAANQNGKRPLDHVSPELPNVNNSELDRLTARVDALRQVNEAEAEERAEALRTQHAELENQRLQKARLAAQAKKTSAPVSQVANPNQPPLPATSNPVPIPPSFSVHSTPGRPVSRLPGSSVPLPPGYSNPLGKTNDGSRSWQEEANVALLDGPPDDRVGSPAAGHIAVQPLPGSLEDALGTMGRADRLISVRGGMAGANSGGFAPGNAGRRVNRGGRSAGRTVSSLSAPAVSADRVSDDGRAAVGGGSRRRSPDSSDSSSDEDDETRNPTYGARYTGPRNRRHGRGWVGASRKAVNVSVAFVGDILAKGVAILNRIWWPALKWFVAVSMLVGILSIFLGSHRLRAPSIPSFSFLKGDTSLSDRTVVFTDKQYQDFKAFWEGRATATEMALREVQSTLPDVVRVTKDRHGNIIVAKEFWEAILDRMKHEPSILKLDKGRISEAHWNAIRSRIKSTGLDQSFEDWFEKNKHRISGLLSGHPITKPVTSEAETYQDTVTSRQYVENLQQQISKSRKEFEKELESLRRELHGLIEEQRHKTGGLTKTEIRKLVKDIIDKELGSSLIRPGKQSPTALVMDMLSRHVNWFSFGNGAQIDTSITSPTFRIERPAMGTVAWFRTFAKKPQFLHDSLHATSLWTDSGHCWCAGIFAGKDKEKLPADIGISVAGLIIPKYVVVENINPGATTDPGSMPKDIEIWAKFENKAKNSQMHKWMNTHFPTAAANPRNAGQLREEFVQIGKFEYEYRHVDNGVFIHKLSDELITLDAVVETVLIRAVTNNGSPDHTCFYRLRLYGQEVDERTGKHIGSSSW